MPKPETTREPKKPRDLEDDGNGIFLRLEMAIVDVWISFQGCTLLHPLSIPFLFDPI